MSETISGPTFDGTYRTMQTNDLGWQKYGSIRSTTNTYSRVRDPKWREKIRRLANATNPYSFTGYSSHYGMSPVHWFWAWYAGGLCQARLEGTPLFDTLFGPVGSAPWADESQYLTEVKLAFLKKIKQHESPWASGVFAGEWGKTMEMVRSLRHPLKKIVKNTRKYRQSLMFQAKNTVSRRADNIADNLGDLYLEWTYGVAPLLGDIRNVGLAWNNLMAKEQEVVRISVTIPTFIGKVPIYSGSTFLEGGGIHLKSDSFYSKDIKSQIRGALNHRVQGPMWSRVQQNVSLNLRDFVPTLYELIPYSFIVDYVSTLGDCVNGICTNTSNLIYVCQSIKQTITGEIHVTGSFPTKGIPLSGPSTTVLGRLQKVSFNRKNADLTVRFSDLRLTPPNTRQMFNMFVLGLSKLRSVTDRVLFPKD